MTEISPKTKKERHQKIAETSNIGFYMNSP
jgi:hypothetical protein